MDFVLWYRKDIFEKAGLDPNRPPRTWSELIATCEKLKQSGVVEYPIAVPGAIHLATDQLIYTLMVVAGAEHLFGENPNEIVFNNPNTVKAYAFYKQLFSYSPPGSETWRWDEPRTALFTGKVAMVMEKGHYIKGWVDNTNLPLDYLGCGFIPIPDEGGQPGTIFYANGLTLLTADPVKREAFKTFIKWLYQPHIMSWLLHMDPGFFLPPTQEVLYSDAFWSDPIIRQKVAAVMIELESLKYGRLPGFTRAEVNPNVGAISAANLLAWTAQLITVKGLSPEEAVALGAQEMAKAVR
jgi:ABC-type glycerol-3-phosphate transport system substrate-binding protein